MKKKLSYILIGIVIIIGGYLLVSEYQKKQIVKEAQKKVEIFFYIGTMKISVKWL